MSPISSPVSSATCMQSKASQIQHKGIKLLQHVSWHPTSALSSASCLVPIFSVKDRRSFFIFCGYLFQLLSYLLEILPLFRATSQIFSFSHFLAFFAYQLKLTIYSRLQNHQFLCMIFFLQSVFHGEHRFMWAQMSIQQLLKPLPQAFLNLPLIDSSPSEAATMAMSTA